MRLSKDGATEQCAKGGESFPGPIGPAGQRTLNLDRALCRGAGTKGIELFPPPPDPLRLRQHFFSDTSDEPQGGVLCLGARREHAERGTSGDSGVGRPDPERSGGSLAGGLRGRRLPEGLSRPFPSGPRARSRLRTPPCRLPSGPLLDAPHALPEAHGGPRLSAGHSSLVYPSSANSNSHLSAAKSGWGWNKVPETG